MSDLDPSTLAVTAGRPPRAAGGPVNEPVAFTSVFHAGAEVSYARHDHPNWRALEAAIGALEGGDALVFASGLAAATAVFETLPPAAGVDVQADAYNGTRQLADDLVAQGRVTYDGAEPALVWIETPSNPMLRVTDIAAAADDAHGRGALLAVDNTFATPLVQRPLELGADVVVHSATKLLAGHSDVVLGAVVTRDAALLERLHAHRALHGAIAGPMEAFLVLRGLRTLAVRLERMQATASELARRLGAHPSVERVHHPGFGTMVSFEVAGGAPAADAVCDGVGLIVHTTSLGGVETLIERRARYAGEEATPPGLLRMSVGLEHVDDLWRDLDGALRAATR